MNNSKKQEKEQQNFNQIIRKDAKSCFIESLNDCFRIGKAHLRFVKYDVSKPAKSRQTDMVDIFVDISEIMELQRQFIGGEMRCRVEARKDEKDTTTPLFECMGGVSDKKLKAQDRRRKDKKSLSRIARLVIGSKKDFMFIAQSGPGEESEKGLIVPKFGDKPENNVAVPLLFADLSELILMTVSHYNAWLTGWYIYMSRQAEQAQNKRSNQDEDEAEEENSDYDDEDLEDDDDGEGLGEYPDDDDDE